MAEEGQTPEQENPKAEVSAATSAQSVVEPVDESVDIEAVEDVSEATVAAAEVTLESLQEELGTAKDAALRAQAEAQNARRRSEQDLEKARKFGLERFAGEMLSVVDNLERALAASGGDAEEAKAMAEGVDLTLKGLLDVFSRFNIEPVDPQGEPFDPNSHQAITMVPHPDMEPNTVINVVQKGYTLSGRLIRPAMVVVSKAPEQGD